MKKIIHSSIFFTLLLTLVMGCKKDDNEPAPGERPEERMNAALTEYRSALVGSEYGWKAYLFPQGGGGYGFYMDFTDNDRVRMLGDLNETISQELFESTFRLKAAMAPSLLFDTYSYIHLLADPTPSAYGGTAGRGYGSDFEFEIFESRGDSLFMLGKKWRSVLVLIKSTQEEQSKYLEGGFGDFINTVKSYTSANQNLFISPDDTGIQVQVSVNMTAKTVSLVWVENNEVITESSPFAFSPDGLELLIPVAYHETVISRILWNVNGNGFTTLTPDGATFNVQVSPQPILPLHMLLGINYSAITVPPVLIGGGNSPSFIQMHTTLKAVLNTGTYFLLRDISFTFNTLNQRLIVRSVMPQTEGGSTFASTFNFSYEKDGEGNYTFTYTGYADYGSYTAARFMPLLNKLQEGKYKIDYFVFNGVVYGQFISLDDPEFYFVGRL